MEILRDCPNLKVAINFFLTYILRNIILERPCITLQSKAGLAWALKHSTFADANNRGLSVAHQAGNTVEQSISVFSCVDYQTFKAT